MEAHRLTIKSRTRFTALFLLCVATLLLPNKAHAQRLLVITQALNTIGQAARVYVSSVDIASQQTPNDTTPLPGTTAIGKLHLSIDRNNAVITSGFPWSGGDFSWRHAETFLSNMSTVPLQAHRDLHHDTFGQSRKWIGNLTQSPTQPRILLLGIHRSEDNKVRGTLQSLPWMQPTIFPSSAPNASPTEDFPTWHLEGPPVAAISLIDRAPNLIAVLYASPRRGAILAIGDPIENQKPTQTHTLGIIDHVVDTKPIALERSPDGKFLCAIIAGFALDTPQGAALSWLYTIDVDSQELIGEPVPLLGEPNPRYHPLRMTLDNRCWIATRTLGTDFAYATKIRLTTENVEKEIEYAMAGVENSFIIAPAPDNETVAVAIGNRLEIWPNGRRQGTNTTYEAPINVLTWNDDGLVAAEAGRVHRVDETTGSPKSTVQLQSGHVTNLAILPSIDPTVSELDNGNTNQDSTMIDPHLEARSLVLLHGEAAGRELQVVRIEPNDNGKNAWQVSFDQEATPWLLIHVISEPVSQNEAPYAGRGQGLIYMGAFPAHYKSNGILRTTLNIEWLNKVAQTPNQNTQVDIRIIPPRSHTRQILWLRSEDDHTPFRHHTDPIAMRALAQQLAASPHRFSHREVFGPFTEPLEPYTVVVIDTKAIAKGVITRQAIWQYVAEGGALLILGNHAPDDSLPNLARWLQPAGVQLNTSAPISGTFTPSTQPRPLHRLNNLQIKEGLSINANNNDIQVPGDSVFGGSVFLARQYAYGRFAILAAPTPLQSNVLENEDARLFAHDLFQWLAIAGHEIKDFDGDGLTNDIEDRNNNGQVGDDETDPLNPDTDNDGISDGMEDLNRNGRIDTGETDPRNRDSDDDGIFDGADATPVP